MAFYYLEILSTFLINAVDLLAVIIISWGAFKAILNFIKVEFFQAGDHKEQSLEALRVKFGQKILIGLEFFVASDLIKLIISPTFEALGKLAGFVAIRVVLSYFLNHEIQEIREKHWKKSGIRK